MWKEVLTTQDIKKYSRAIEMLSANSIQHRTRISDKKNSSFGLLSALSWSRRARTGVLLERDAVQNTYYIYVRRKDVSFARKLLGTAKVVFKK